MSACLGTGRAGLQKTSGTKQCGASPQCSLHTWLNRIEIAERSGARDEIVSRLRSHLWFQGDLVDPGVRGSECRCSGEAASRTFAFLVRVAVFARRAARAAARHITCRGANGCVSADDCLRVRVKRKDTGCWAASMADIFGSIEDSLKARVKRKGHQGLGWYGD